MKVVTVIGARPQFIKAWPVSMALSKRGIEECLLHTGQHYDHEMSGVFFEELGMKKPDINLDVGSGSHAVQTARMLEGIEVALIAKKPSAILLYGDTNSTLAGALAAVKLHIPVVHVEAGLRSFNRKMPEEHNRIITDHCSDLLFCPTETAVRNLEREGITKGVHQCEDVMYDAIQLASPIAVKKSKILQELQLSERGYALATIHRAENVDSTDSLKAILEGLASLGIPIILPMHPRTRNKLSSLKISLPQRIRMISPLGYINMVRLIQGAAVVLTDSGGLQKETIWLGKPCITLREETEWVETLKDNANQLAGANSQKIKTCYNNVLSMSQSEITTSEKRSGSKIIAKLISKEIK